MPQDRQRFLVSPLLKISGKSFGHSDYPLNMHSKTMTEQGPTDPAFMLKLGVSTHLKQVIQDSLVIQTRAGSCT